MHQFSFYGHAAVVAALMFFEPWSITGLQNIISPTQPLLNMDDIEENQGLHPKWKTTHIYRRQRARQRYKLGFPTAAEPGYMGPSEFANYFGHLYIRYNRTFISNNTVEWGFWYQVPPKTTKRMGTTSARGHWYHELFWENGDRILDANISATDLSYNPTNRYIMPSKEPFGEWQKGTKYDESFFCRTQCNRIFLDWGPVCGARLISETGKWYYQYKSFKHYCALLNFNCAYKFWATPKSRKLAVPYRSPVSTRPKCFGIAMRGRCPNSFIDSNSIKRDENFLPGDAKKIQEDANIPNVYSSSVLPYLLNVDLLPQIEQFFPGRYNTFTGNTLRADANLLKDNFWKIVYK